MTTLGAAMLGAGRVTVLGFVTLAVACGGTAVIDGRGAEGGAGGSGGTATTSSTTATTTSSTGSGPGGCTSHADCPDESLCLFDTGECIPSCGGLCDPCDPGTICDDCAASSCPGCKNCIPACRPIQPGECDDNDTCLEGDQVCNFDAGQCLDGCLPGGGCADPAQICQGCVTGSCCGCDDCVSACIMP